MQRNTDQSITSNWWLGRWLPILHNSQFWPHHTPLKIYVNCAVSIKTQNVKCLWYTRLNYPYVIRGYFDRCYLRHILYDQRTQHTCIQPGRNICMGHSCDLFIMVNILRIFKLEQAIALIAVTQPSGFLTSLPWLNRDFKQILQTHGLFEANIYDGH